MVPRAPPPPTPRDSAVSPCFLGCPALLHRHFPHIPSIRLSAVNSSPHPGIVPQSLNSSRCPFQETHVPAWHMCGCSKDCLILIQFALPQISCFTLSLKCFSSDSDSCPDVGIRPLLQFPHPPRAGPILLCVCVCVCVCVCTCSVMSDSL